MQIYLVVAEHYNVPGIITKAFRRQEDAEAECLELANIMLEDAKLPHADSKNWRGCVEVLQDMHGAAHCYVECEEVDVR